MSDAWEDMKRTKEEEYFQRQNKEVLTRRAEKKDEEAAGTQKREKPGAGLLQGLIKTIKELIGK